MNDKLGFDLTFCQRVKIFIRIPRKESFLSIFRGFYVDVDEKLRNLIEHMRDENKAAKCEIATRKIKCIQNKISHAVSNENLDLLQLLVEKKGLKIEPLHSHHVHSAVSKGRKNVDLVRYLVEHNALSKENLQNDEGNTPLHIAIEADNFNMADYLLTINIDMNVENKDGEFPLYVAINNDNFRIAERMLSVKYCDLNMENSNGDNHFHIAANYDNTEMLELLMKFEELNGGSEIYNHWTKENKYGYSPLHLAIIQCFSK
ncbi:MAG: ankyrin repeat domain-containing protein [Endozoicomonadaceae bacterium]|nr:ankyrin repeat domain-containing protein [Endozoicomonadaceae bacterium]